MKVEFDANKYDRGLEEIDEEELLSKVNVENNQFRVLNEILNSENDCATLLELFYLEDLSWKEIGKEMGVTDTKDIAKLRKQKERCLKKIRTTMEDKLMMTS